MNLVADAAGSSLAWDVVLVQPGEDSAHGTSRTLDRLTPRSLHGTVLKHLSRLRWSVGHRDRKESRYGVHSRFGHCCAEHLEQNIAAAGLRPLDEDLRDLDTM